MNNPIFVSLKRKMEEISAMGQLDVETRRNVLKESLQYYILDFIYHYDEFSRWVMYGGSALRLCHGLNRMSVDLDFEVDEPVTGVFLNNLQNEIVRYFAETYNAGQDFLTVKITNKRGLLLKFYVGDELGLGHRSAQVHIKIDLNHFVAPKTVKERIPVNRDQFSFVIVIYNMSSLMASKIAAVLSRGRRGVGAAVYEEKGRDIYDLLWYMERNIVPDMDYLTAKKIDISNLRALFDRLTIQMNKVNDANLKQDLTPLFIDQRFIANWLVNWRESYFHLLGGYKIRTVTTLKSVEIFQDFRTDTFSFVYRYNTEDGGLMRFFYSISDYWMDFRDGDLSVSVDKKIESMVEFKSNGVSNRSVSRELLNKYAALFYQKTESHLKKVNNIMLGDGIMTKTIRMTADKLNQKEQIVLNKSALLSCELEDLLK